MGVKFGTLTAVSNLRDYWKHEALEFTPWLAKEENISILADAIGMDIEVVETESTVGSFSVDILAREINTDRVIIIENQLEETNHDHLGKIITYASGKDASYVVWLVRKAREEHRRAIEWLNNRTDENVGFFLVEIELWTIDSSAPAVRFQVVEKPNGWVNQIKKENALMTEGEKLKQQFWSAYVDHAFASEVYAQKFRCRKPGSRHWYDLIPVGIRGFSLSLLTDTRTNKIGVEVYISDNKELYRSFYARKKEIEADVGAELDWRELPERKASRIVLRRDGGLDKYGNWNDYFDWMKEYSLKMLDAFVKASAE